ncbi:MAG TPA: AAA family ATPase [Clostridia bacterium]|nr:AAA family ATPase [Clostridia bacterium]
MTAIRCKFFGTPEVFKDGERIIFPYKKAEALFYYLVLKKQCFRDILVEMLWGSVEEETAKKSLRNAMYIVNKTFEGNVLVSPKRAIIMLNPEITFESDVDVFFKDDSCTSIEAYEGEYLEGFLVKDADSFDKWIFSVRNQYRDLYITKLHKQIKKCIKEKKLTEVELFCKNLIAVDEFNEKAYRILMNAYRRMGLYEKSIDVYNELTKLLKKELSITPDQRTNELFGEIVKEKAARQTFSRNEAEGFFYGRQKELRFLGENYYRFISEKKGRSIVIMGEAGLGKTALINRHLKVVEDEKTIILKTNCYQAEESYLLKPWSDILYQLSRVIEEEKIEVPVLLQRIVGQIFPAFAIKDEYVAQNPIEQIDILKYQAAEKAIIDIFKHVSGKKKILLIFEDIQWIDSMSLSLMNDIIMDNKNQTLIFIASARTSQRARIERFIVASRVNESIQMIELNRFNREETIEFASGMMPDLDIDVELGNSIYRETEGNTFFIVEFLNNLKHNEKLYSISPKMQDIIKSRFLSVSDEGMKILNIISLFFDMVTLEELLEVSGKSELELLDIIGELEEKNLVKEIGEVRNVSFTFTHQKLREFVYSQLSVSKRRILHSRIAKLLESRLRGDKRDTLLYSKLIYHFTNGGYRLSALKYTIKNLEQYLGINHEIFPVFNEGSADEDGILEISEEQLTKDLDKVRELIKEIKNEEGYNKDLEKIELSFMHIVGRGYIRSGNYKQGLALIKDMTDHALRIEDYSMAIKGYKQMIYFCINTFNTGLMEGYIEEAIKTAEKCCLRDELCILLRLKGMQRIMDGRFSEGENILKQAISMFESLEYREKYILNIAACYNFIGESKRRSMEFYSSMSYYDKAIAICREKNVIRGIPIFSTNAGQAAYDMGDYAKAKSYLSGAIEAFMQLNSFWSRSTAYGYMALLYVKESRYEDALSYMIKAEKYSEIMQSPYEKALIYRVKAEIRKNMDFYPGLKEFFSEYLTDQVVDYCDKGIGLLKKIKNCYELDILKNLKGSWW